MLKELRPSKITVVSASAALLWRRNSEPGFIYSAAVSPYSCVGIFAAKTVESHVGLVSQYDETACNYKFFIFNNLFGVFEISHETTEIDKAGSGTGTSAGQ